MTRLRRGPWLEAGWVALLFAVALAIRLYGLHQWPPGLYNDEAANGIDALGILTGHRPLFFERNNGREPLFIYLQALSIALFGATPYALRVTAAVIGAFTVPAVYWMTREAFARTTVSARWLAAWTALFLAFSYWHISLSRIGFRAIMLPLMSALAFGWFWRAWRKLDIPADERNQGRRAGLPWLELALCGVFVGLSLYTYTAARFIPVVIVVVTLAGALLTRSAQRAKRVVLGLGVIGIAAALVFAPLGAYFFTHPGAFLGRAASVSILSSEFAAEGPVASLLRSVAETTKMFFATHDPNLRHNPAQRPVFDAVMAAWIAVGLLIALVRWRSLPYLFSIAWLLLLAIPAGLSSEGVPHSLRAIGMLPVSILLGVLAMSVAGQRLLPTRRLLASCLPLPFLLLSGYTSLRDYFTAWDDLERFRVDFQTEYVDVAKAMAGHSSDDAIWILPISPNYHLSDAEFYTIEFFARDRFGSVLADEQAAPAQLAEVVKGNRYALLVEPQSLGDRSAAYVFGDPKHLLEFLLRKYGRQTAPLVGDDSSMAYSSFELPASNRFSIAEGFLPMEVSFADRVQLTEAAYGRTAVELDEPPGAVDSTTLPSGHPLWVVLHWKALAPIDVDLKASLILKDPAGNVAGQVDDLLVSDRYPLERPWESNEKAGTYHILPTLPAIPPGRYELFLKVYEDATLRPYPVTGQDGDVQGAELRLGPVDVVRSAGPTPVSPGTPLSPAPALGPELALLGYDLPAREVRPGDTLPLTLYWRARNQPTQDYQVRVELREATGQPVVAQEMSPANDAYPTTEWETNEVVRDWHRLPISTGVASGVLDLVVAVVEKGQPLAETSLGQVTVEGRPRLMEAPPLAFSQPAVFGERVALLGVAAPDTLEVAPGDTITLTVAWQALSTPTEDLVRFVHVLGPDGRPVSQKDGIPCNGACRAASWLPGEILLDEISLQLPEDLPPGTYPLGVGWYDSSTVQRLPAHTPDGQALTDNLAVLALEVGVRSN